jgi:NDP-sugar pyrophosphorylase family protein
MKAMVLCAGMGSRLGELTRQTPKPLLPIGDCSIVGHILSNLRRHGFQDIVINLHFEADQISAALGDGSMLGVRITYSQEPKLLGTAGGVRKMRSFFAHEKAFLVHYGDIVTNEDFSAMREFHLQRDALVTLLVHKRSKSNSSMILDGEQRVLQFWERPDRQYWEATQETWVNSGILLASPEVLDLIPEGTVYDWPRDVIPQLLASQRVYGYPLRGYRTAVDSPERLEQARRDVAAGFLKLKVGS